MRMKAPTIKLNVAERLLAVGVVLLIVIYCTSWTTSPYPMHFTLTPPAVVANKSLTTAEFEDRQPKCGFDTFRSVARQHQDGYIAGSGTWTRNGSRGGFDGFQPTVCRLTHGKWIPDDVLATCLRRHRVRYIAIIGDSNGRYYLRMLQRILAEALVEFQQRRRIDCGPVVRHNGLTYDSYRSANVLVKHRCPCGGYCSLEFTLQGSMRFVHCYVLQARCTVDNDTEVVMEYITSWFTIDPKVHVCHNHHRRQWCILGALDTARAFFYRLLLFKQREILPVDSQ